MHKLTSKKFWNNSWKKFKIKGDYMFHDLLKRHFLKNKNKTCIEIGCVPGRFLFYLAKNFKYKVYGVDFAETNKMRDFFKSEKIPIKIYQKDFLKFKTKVKFDVVCSFGFIEHFDDYETIFKKHVDLLNKNGKLIIEMPNFRYGQKILHSLFDKPNLKRHNLEIMNLIKLKELCKKYDLNILYLNYFKTIDFWISQTDKHLWLIKKAIGLFSLLFECINKLINFPNKSFSPYIVLVAKKKCRETS